MTSVLLLAAAIASASAETVPFSGQGVPRETKEDCGAAAKALAEKLAALSFQGARTECVGTSAEIGGWVPVVKAVAPARFSTEQLIGGRSSDEASCKKALEKLTAGIANGDLLESQCLAGKEVDFKNKSTAYFQPWATRLNRLGQAPKKAEIEADLQGNKSVTSSAQPTSPPPRRAAPAAGKQSTSE